VQVPRNRTDPLHDFSKDKQFKIHDWDALFSVKFRQTMKADLVEQGIGRH
jgi:hypothetical protein